eukprot:117718_1
MLVLLILQHIMGGMFDITCTAICCRANYCSRCGAWHHIAERNFCYKREMRILMIGLDNCGKTSILYRLKMNTFIETKPTIGFNVETIDTKKCNYTCWDIGGQIRIRDVWKHYYEHYTQAIIFVVDDISLGDYNHYFDANGYSRKHSFYSLLVEGYCRKINKYKNVPTDILNLCHNYYNDGSETSVQVLHTMLQNDEFKMHCAGCPIIIFANKQDLPNRLSIKEIEKRLGLEYISHSWKVIGCSAKENIGLRAGFDWIDKNRK